MNLAQMNAQLRRAANRPLLRKCVHEVASHALELSLQRLASGAGEGLEVRIADDFDRLPGDVADDFWADALSERTEDIPE
jgi:hypothetical protein